MSSQIIYFSTCVKCTPKLSECAPCIAAQKAFALSKFCLCAFQYVSPLQIERVLALPVLPDLLLTLGTQMPTPAVVVELFEDPDMVVLAWIHILALDTLAGRHIWRRMLVAGRPGSVSFPVLLFCLLLGPLGFAAGMALTWNVSGSDLPLTGEAAQKAQDSSTS